MPNLPLQLKDKLKNSVAVIFSVPHSTLCLVLVEWISNLGWGESRNKLFHTLLFLAQAGLSITNHGLGYSWISEITSSKWCTCALRTRICILLQFWWILTVIYQFDSSLRLEEIIRGNEAYISTQNWDRQQRGLLPTRKNGFLGRRAVLMLHHRGDRRALPSDGTETLLKSKLLDFLRRKPINYHL